MAHVHIKGVWSFPAPPQTIGALPEFRLVFPIPCFFFLSELKLVLLYKASLTKNVVLKKMKEHISKTVIRIKTHSWVKIGPLAAMFRPEQPLTFLSPLGQMIPRDDAVLKFSLLKRPGG